MSSLPFDPPGESTLAGEVVVFTGKLSSLRRKEAHALVARFGGTAADEVSARTTMLVVGAETFPESGEPARAESAGDGRAEQTQKLKKAQALNAAGQAGIRIVSEEEFCQRVWLQSPGALRQQYYALRDILAMYPGMREDHVRYLQKWGFIRAAVRTNAESYFAFPDLLVIRQTSAELERGASFRTALRSLAASREGQLALDFRLDASPAKIISLEAATRRTPSSVRADAESPPPEVGERARSDAAELFLLASSLDGDPRTHDQAAAAYRNALEIDPGLAAALINLANIHYARDELAEAQALYERAISIAPDFFEAHFNLGNIYHDLARYAEAEIGYRDALALNPDYAEAHFYLAVTLEKLGRSQAAKPHWRAYQRLAPDGEWAELAREFSQ